MVTSNENGLFEMAKRLLIKTRTALHVEYTLNVSTF